MNNIEAFYDFMKQTSKENVLKAMANLPKAEKAAESANSMHLNSRHMSAFWDSIQITPKDEFISMVKSGETPALKLSAEDLEALKGGYDWFTLISRIADAVSSAGAALGLWGAMSGGGASVTTEYCIHYEGQLVICGS